MRRLIAIALLTFPLVSCAPMQEVDVPTESRPTASQVEVATASQPEPTATFTETATPSPRPTSTPQPTDTPSATATDTVEPRLATQTAMAAERQATRARNQWIDSVRADCPAIDYRELLEYAQEHVGECVSIRGRIWNSHLDEGWFDLEVGFYSGQVPINVQNVIQDGRLYEDDWVMVYGDVKFGEYSTITGSFAKGSLDARIIEGPRGVLWLKQH